ncbi:hypothetical protein AciX8_4549 [Granulicella mallensis MP5ACTX8]|uniref:Uncharacterized protein n=1 Tax=Granulicella mallensis (strain ATCC BAA-1857 / DSM 23137 / MP5ACTX8) TaxID=682795 RepID=G8NVR7_GRAMM|nr:hypothetical protein AciX8_4549 [Granulicella mallensis MP5ACTX8]
MPAKQPRTLLLFDPAAQPQSWNERMADGEFAVLYAGAIVQPITSQDDISAGHSFCTVFSSLPAAEVHATQQVALHPTLRCRIYDRYGLGQQPVREVAGGQHKGESEITPRFRRWVGSVLFFGGLGLTLFDWHADFRFGWPSMLGTRMLPTGLVLLFIELAILLNAAQKRRKQTSP